MIAVVSSPDNAGSDSGAGSSRGSQVISEFQPDAVEIEERVPPRIAFLTLYVMMLLIAAAVLWTSVSFVDKIVVAPATTIEGLCVNAHVGCWRLLGHLDDPGEKATASERITLSTMRDLIRLRHPDLERPGALTRLVREIEEPVC